MITKFIPLLQDQTPSNSTAAAGAQRQLNFSGILENLNESNQSSSESIAQTASNGNASASVTPNSKKQRKDGDDYLAGNLSIQRESYKLQNDVLLLQKQKLQIGIKTAELQYEKERRLADLHYEKEKRLAELDIAIKEKELAKMTSE